MVPIEVKMDLLVVFNDILDCILEDYSRSCRGTREDDIPSFNVPCLDVLKIHT